MNSWRFRQFAIVLCLSVSSAVASTIKVPGDQPTIQAGINAAVRGDTVLVSPGKYTENLNFMGKAITVKGANGSKSTTIDGSQSGPVVIFITGEGRSSVLQGFTLRNGRGNTASSFSGGGVYIDHSSPTIRNNVVVANVAAVGGGIGVFGGSPVIANNIITSNIHDPNISGGWGGGITLDGGSSALVTGNTISHHFWTGGLGGGVAIRTAGSPMLMNNKILSNTADQSPGGGIWIVDSSPTLIQNLVILNTAFFGGGIYVSLTSTKLGATFVNNTFAHNVGNNGGIIPGDGSATYLVGLAGNVRFFNNIMTSSAGRETLFCSPTGALPVFRHSDVFSASAIGYGGSCSSLNGTNGNVSANPQFVNPAHQKYQLSAASPAIDIGTNSAPHLPKKDLAGRPRIVDGDRDGNAIVDAGAYEF